MAQSHLGEIKNKPICSYSAITSPQAANTILTKGSLVYQDAALGVKLAPINGSKNASNIGVIENNSVNNPGALGDKSVEIYKAHCIAVILLDGVMPIGGRGRASTTTAGRGEKIADPTEINSQILINKHYLFDYLGHVDEYLNANKLITAATGGEEIVVAFK